MLLSAGIEQWLRNGIDVPAVPWAGSGWYDLFHASLGASSHSTSSLQTVLTRCTDAAAARIIKPAKAGVALFARF